MQATYWNNKGQFQQLAEALEKLIPSSGSVDRPYKNKKLEKFRKAVNAYYDIFNNGGCNRGQSISRTFGVTMSHYSDRYGKYRGQISQHGWERIHAKVEPIMDAIILEAAKEQGLQAA